MNISAAINYAHVQSNRFLDDLIDFLKIPSVSTSPDHKGDMARAAHWVANRLSKMGFEGVEIFPTARHPVVYGEWLHAGEDRKTVLIYGHYDVQPAEPLDLWQTPPFEPTIRGENLYARGASDMKGQICASLAAVDSLLSVGQMPVNIKFIIEGEEEIGSPDLVEFLETHKDLLASDFALNPDSGMVAVDTPTIIYAMRGLAYFELRVFGPAHDLHSGMFGGVVHNPAVALCSLIAGMHDPSGRITLPGFYDRVKELSLEEKQYLANNPAQTQYYLDQTGAHALWGETGFSPAERVGARPTLDVNGLFSGFTGEGSKTVIPAWAMAKISMRLVPDQDPQEVHQQLLDYLRQNAPETIRWELMALSGGKACLLDINKPEAKALAKSLQAAWDRPPVLKREGGSIPVVADMQRILGIDSVMTGFGLPDDNLHAPNEKLHLATWYKGIDALIHFFCSLQTRN